MKISKYNLPTKYEKLINSFKPKMDKDKFGNDLYRFSCPTEYVYSWIAKPLDCELGTKYSYNGFCFNSDYKFVLEWAEGDVILILCEANKYVETLADTVKFYAMDNMPSNIKNEEQYIIDSLVEFWHTRHTGVDTLREFLGMTIDEYSHILENDLEEPDVCDNIDEEIEK